MGIQKFIEELRKLGYEPEYRENGKVVFSYVPLVGRFAGQSLTLGLTVADDFPLNPPTGPRVSPRLLPLYPGGDKPHPEGGVHAADDYESPPGSTLWEYWSRPFQNWQSTDRSVRTYLRHIQNLFAGIL